ncbi:hypothetical protein EBME_0756 [bacterium endosymbiont of Mortierella elongata FMR23-6]|nr:hypothetical protein EBME_0756 [bacterium endosymbiont of Mortierella elongata FMR23-6]
MDLVYLTRQLPADGLKLKERDVRPSLGKTKPEHKFALKLSENLRLL